MHPILYEVNTRVWLRELGEAHGAPITLATVPEHELEYWSGLGFTHVWLMGVWTTGPKTQQRAREHAGLQARLHELLPHADVSALGASPYAIQHYRVASYLGGNEALKKLRGRLNAHGMKLVLDFVPNHVGLDHPWVFNHPERFVRAPAPKPGYVTEQTAEGIQNLAHGRDPYFPPWTDTFQLDYRRAETRVAMARELQKVATLCDGVRCDMAMLVLTDVFQRTWGRLPDEDWQEEFWPGAIAYSKKKNPELCLMAEVYWGLEGRLRDLGFDYTYDKELYDHLFAGCAEKVYKHIVSEPALARGVHFLENHDEQRVGKRLSPAEHHTAAVLMLCLPGMRFLHQGQLTGATEHIPVQFLTAPATLDQTVREFYEHLLHVLKGSVIGRGKWRVETPNGSDQPLVIIWEKGGRKAVAAVNLSNEFTEFVLPTPAGGESRGFVDLATGRALSVNEIAGGALSVRVPPGRGCILEFGPSK